MCSCTSSGSTLRQWPVLCPSLLSFRPYPTNPAQLLGWKLNFWSCHLLYGQFIFWSLQQLKVPSPCAASRLCSHLGTEGTSPAGNWANLALMPARQQGLNYDKGGDGHNAMFESNRQEDAWLLQQQGWEDGFFFWEDGFFFLFSPANLPPTSGLCCCGRRAVTFTLPLTSWFSDGQLCRRASGVTQPEHRGEECPLKQIEQFGAFLLLWALLGQDHAWKQQAEPQWGTQGSWHFLWVRSCSWWEQRDVTPAQRTSLHVVLGEGKKKKDIKRRMSKKFKHHHRSSSTSQPACGCAISHAPAVQPSSVPQESAFGSLGETLLRKQKWYSGCFFPLCIFTHHRASQCFPLPSG